VFNSRRRLPQRDRFHERQLAEIEPIRDEDRVVRIPASHVEPDLKSTERYGVIEELLNLLVHAGAITHRAEAAIFEAISAREELMSTGTGGIALPHTHSECVSEPIAAFGWARSCVDFQALDNVPVRCVLLFIVPAKGGAWQLWPPSRRPGRDESMNAGLFEMLADCFTAVEMAELLNRYLFDEPGDDEAQP
jgi:PTS system nitrogen regulatory IIA component